MTTITQRLKLPILGLLLTSGMFACQALEERIAPKKNVELNIPENFDFATIQETEISIITKDEKGNVVSVPRMGIYDKNPTEGGELIYITGTNENGNVLEYHSLPTALESVYIENNIPGLADVTVPVVNGKISHSFTAPVSVKNGRIGEQPVRDYYNAPASTVGYLLYEDKWPNKGDFDLNDLVMKYTFDITPGTNNNVKKIVATFNVVAIGATFNNGFSLHIPNRVAPFLQSTEIKATLSVNNGPNNELTFESYSNPGGSGLIFDIFTPQHLQQDFANTEVNNPTNKYNCTGLPTATLTLVFAGDNGIASNRVGSAPFDPFLFVNGDKQQEVHLATKTQTTSRSTYNTPSSGNDDTNDNYKADYIVGAKDNGMPFALVVPTTRTTTQASRFKVPIEKTPIFLAYKNFQKWAESGGSIIKQGQNSVPNPALTLEEREWYKHYNSDKVISETCQ